MVISMTIALRVTSGRTVIPCVEKYVKIIVTLYNGTTGWLFLVNNFILLIRRFWYSALKNSECPFKRCVNIRIVLTCVHKLDSLKGEHVLSFPSPLMMSTRPRMRLPSHGMVNNMMVLPASVLCRNMTDMGYTQTVCMCVCITHRDVQGQTHTGVLSNL